MRNDNTMPGKKIFGLNPNIFFLGLTSMLTDISSEMIFTLIPFLLSNLLGVQTALIGVIGGISESSDSIFRIFSGWFSDKIGKRKMLTIFGYSLSAITKPFMYFAASWAGVLVIRVGDRLGKGIRTAPRDALVADSVSKEERGKGFGIHRAMDTTGAVLGLAIAAVIIYFVQPDEVDLTSRAYHYIVLVGIIPAVLAVIGLIAFVKEPKRAGTNATQSFKSSISGFSSRFKVYLGIMALFSLGNFSSYFIMLKAQSLGVSVFYVIVMLVLFNVVYALTSIPAGMLSDKMGRRGIIVVGWTIFTLVYLGFAVCTSVWQIWILFGFYGVYFGLVEGVAKAYVADLIPAEKRGTAYGLYNGIVGIALFFASVIAGWIWQNYSSSATFYTGAALTFLAMLCILTLMRKVQK